MAHDVALAEEGQDHKANSRCKTACKTSPFFESKKRRKALRNTAERMKGIEPSYSAWEALSQKAYADLPPRIHLCMVSMRTSEIHIALAPVKKAAAFIVAIGSSGSGQLML